MASNEKLCLDHVAVETIPNVQIKVEKEWLPEDLELPEFALGIDSVQSIKTEVEIPNVAEQNIKTEVALDAEYFGDKHDSDSASYAQENKLYADGQQRYIMPVKDSDSDKTNAVCHNINAKEFVGEHIREVDSKRPYKCEYCSGSFKKRVYLKKHLVTHAKDRKREYVCDSCPKQFYNKPDLARHMKLHTDGTHNCEECGALFTQMENLKTHMHVKHYGETGQSIQNHQTPSDAPGPTASGFTLDHEFVEDKSHSSSPPHVQETDDGRQSKLTTAYKESETCEFCHKIYPKEFIETHMSQTHFRTFRCDLCPLSFNEKKYLERHMIIHTKDRKRDYACDSCEKAFYNKGDLVRHVKVHSGDTHICELCNGRFKRSDYLKLHMLNRHSSDGSSKGQRYKCHYCDKRYLHIYLLRVHMKEHTGLPWKCGICGKSMPGIIRLRNHIIKAHGITDTEKVDAFIQKVRTTDDVVEPLLTTETKTEDFHTDSNAYPDWQLTLIPQTHEYIKTELILDDECIDDMNYSTANVPEDQQHAPFITDDQQARVSIANENSGYGQ